MDDLDWLVLPMATALHDLGMVLYAGPMLAFAVLIGLSGRLPRMQRWDVVRTYRAWGAGFGLALGAWVLGLLSGHWAQHGAFRWPTGSLGEQLVLARFLVFFALWAHNVRVEVWTLEPLRRLDSDAGVQDPVAYAAATDRLARALALQGALLLAYVVLYGLA